MQQHRPEQERHDDAAPPYHRDDAYHRPGNAQRVEVNEVGGAKEHADEYYAPVPAERRSMLALGPPEQEQHQAHHEALVDVVPALHHHAVKPHAAVACRSHEILVVKAAHRPEQGGQDDEVNPTVVLEVDALLLSAAAQHEERRHGQRHTNPLVEVKAFAEHYERAHEHHNRARGVDRPYDGEGQMLHAEIAEHPRRQHDDALQYDILVHIPSAACHLEYGAVERVGGGRKHDERQEDERRYERVEEQHGDDGVAVKRLFLKRIVKSEQSCGQKCQ